MADASGGDSHVGVRVLDEQLGWYGVTKFFLSVDEAAKCRLPVRRVFITENKVNGYRLPMMAGSMVLFGMGYGVIELARKAAWLHATEVIYWGDLDSNGFDILSQLRAELPGVRSMLMTPELWARYPEAVVADEGDCQRIPDRLTVREKQAWAIGPGTSCPVGTGADSAEECRSCCSGYLHRMKLRRGCRNNRERA
jgi:hypothetical protein